MMRACVLVSMCFATGGCANYGPLRAGEYDRVEPQLLVEAGRSGDAKLAEPLAAMLTARLDQPASGVTEEQAVEAVIALGRVGEAAHAPVAHRLLVSDPSSSVRYFAARTLHALDPRRMAEHAKAIRQAQTDPLVIEQIDAMLRDGVTAGG